MCGCKTNIWLGSCVHAGEQSLRNAALRYHNPLLQHRLNPALNSTGHTSIKHEINGTCLVIVNMLFSTDGAASSAVLSPRICPEGRHVTRSW